MTNTVAIIFSVAATALTIFGTWNMRKESRVAQREAEHQAKLAAKARADLHATEQREKNKKLDACTAFFMLLALPDHLLYRGKPCVQWVDVTAEKHNPVLSFLTNVGFCVYTAVEAKDLNKQHTLCFFLPNEKEYLLSRMEYLKDNLFEAKPI